MSVKKWRLRVCNSTAVKALQEEWGIPRPLAVLLQTRGITDSEEVRRLFEEDGEMTDPYSLTDMDKAVSRIQAAVEAFEKIAVYGDYDADGVTATAMLYSYLESCGADVQYYIPEREGEGYGMNLSAIDLLHQRGVSLIVTVDNGIASVDEVAYAATLGMDVVITDHHRPQAELPKARAIVDPYKPDCSLPFSDFAGAGVAFKLIMALEGPDCDVQGLLENYADLAAIGTIGDIVPLTGENRTLVRAGLRQITRTDRLGLRELLELSGMGGKALSSVQVAFTVVPRINATGRLGSSDQAVRLLLSEFPEEAAGLAEAVCDDNTMRRQIEAEIVEKAMALLKREPQRLYDRVLVVEGEDWHHGVIGIVASRLTSRFGKPCLVISYSGDQARGSGRSVEGFSLFDAICSCKSCLTRFGGHPMAAGFSLNTENIVRFRSQINAYAASLPEMPFLCLTLDCALEPQELNPDLPALLTPLEPFGTGNPEPVFGLFQMCLENIIPVGGGKHLRLEFTKNGVTVRCMKFGCTPQEFSYRKGDVLDLAVTLEAKVFQGKNTLTVLIRDFKLSSMRPAELLVERALFEQAMRREPLDGDALSTMLPSREDFAVVYRFLRAGNGFRGEEELLLARLDYAMPLQKLLVALLVLDERRLISYETLGGICTASLLPTSGKTDLFDSQILSDLKSLQKDGEPTCQKP